jgi:hypothetical protein
MDEYAEFKIPSSNYENTPNENYTINVKSLQISEIDQPMEVFAVEGSKILPAGKCWLRSNNKRYEIKIILVNCITQLSSIAPVKNGLPPADLELTKNILTNFLRQILIEPKFVNKDLDLSNTPEFKFGGSYVVSNVGGPNIHGITSSSAMFDFCRSKIEPEELRNECILLFFNEYGDTTDISGEAYKLGGADGARIFLPGLMKNTIAHETLHSIGLFHSFDNDGEFTFRLFDTDNIMDYVNGFFGQQDSKRKLTWIWQDTKVKKTNNNNRLISS